MPRSLTHQPLQATRTLRAAWSLSPIDVDALRAKIAALKAEAAWREQLVATMRASVAADRATAELARLQREFELAGPLQAELAFRREVDRSAIIRLTFADRLAEDLGDFEAAAAEYRRVARAFSRNPLGRDGNRSARESRCDVNVVESSSIDRTVAGTGGGRMVRADAPKSVTDSTRWLTKRLNFPIPPRKFPCTNKYAHYSSRLSSICSPFPWRHNSATTIRSSPTHGPVLELDQYYERYFIVRYDPELLPLSEALLQASLSDALIDRASQASRWKTPRREVDFSLCHGRRPRRGDVECD